MNKESQPRKQMSNIVYGTSISLGKVQLVSDFLSKYLPQQSHEELFEDISDCEDESSEPRPVKQSNHQLPSSQTYATALVPAMKLQSVEQKSSAIDSTFHFLEDNGKETDDEIEISASSDDESDSESDDDSDDESDDESNDESDDESNDEGDDKEDDMEIDEHVFEIQRSLEIADEEEINASKAKCQSHTNTEILKNEDDGTSVSETKSVANQLVKISSSPVNVSIESPKPLEKTLFKTAELDSASKSHSTSTVPKRSANSHRWRGFKLGNVPFLKSVQSIRISKPSAEVSKRSNIKIAMEVPKKFEKC